MELFERAVYSAAQDSEFVGLYGMELGAPTSDRVPGFHAGHFFEPKPLALRMSSANG